MKSIINNNQFRNVVFFISLFLFYVGITIFLFWHRVLLFNSNYGLPDADTDGTIWYYWLSIFENNSRFTSMIAFPTGYDISVIPFSNILYTVNLFFISLLGNSLTNIVTVMNLSTLISYPLSAFTAYLLCYRISKDKIYSILGGLVFSFTYFHMLMLRGSLALNHFEFVPLTFLFFLAFIQDKKIYNYIFYIISYILLFSTNVYFGFFHLVFSALFLIYQYLKDIKSLFLYFIFLIVLPPSISLIFNPSFISIFTNITKPMLLENNTNSIRVVDKVSELSNSNDLLTPNTDHFLSNKLGVNLKFSGEHYLGLILVGISLIFILKNKHKKDNIWFYLFVISIILMVNTPILNIFNYIYFSIFGYFRAVHRLSVYSSMFLSVILVLYLKSLNLSSSYKKILITLLLSIILILDAYPFNKTFYKTTNAIEISKFFYFLREDVHIASIIALPLRYSNNNYGTPDTANLLIQTVHQKKLVNGLDPYNQNSVEINKKLNESLTSLITTSEELGVDAILVFNKRVEDASTLNHALSTDTRLTLIYTKSNNKKGSSRIENSFDVNVYAINKNYYD